MANKEKQKNHYTKTIIETIKYMFSETWKYEKSYFFIYLLETLIKSIRPFINILFPKFLIDEIMGQRRLASVITLVATMLILNAICTFTLMITSENLSKRYHPYIHRYFETLLCSKIMRMSFESTENKEILDLSNDARYGLGFSSGIEGIALSLSGLLSSLITLVGTMGLMLTKSPLLIILVLINVAINSIVNKKINNLQLKQFKRLSYIARAFEYIHFQLSDIRYGKDIRLYHAEEMMLKKADDYNSEQTEIMRRQSHKIFGYTSITNINIAATAGLSYLYLGYKALIKSLSIGDFTMMSTATSTFSSSLNSIISEILGLQLKCTYAYKFVAFMKSKDFMPASGENHCENIEKCTIEFKNVYFAYPGSDNYVLEDVSIKINNGEHLSIVGLNGSGKSTFIKLLCRLYPVNKGEILLNGINIQDYDYSEYNKLISVVFQDFKLLPFTLKENIAFKDAQTIEDRALEPLIQKVGLTKKLKDLKKGLHTHLFKYYEIDGFEPSGGEQQKIAIARALYKDAPIVVLDEPTAALDPMAEYEIYKQFNELVAGKTAFYISHRLSSCKFCDQIAVFSEGRIKEYGTHQELLKIKQGLYSEMFLAQAQYYS